MEAAVPTGDDLVRAEVPRFREDETSGPYKGPHDVMAYYAFVTEICVEDGVDPVGTSTSVHKQSLGENNR